LIAEILRRTESKLTKTSGAARLPMAIEQKQADAAEAQLGSIEEAIGGGTGMIEGRFVMAIAGLSDVSAAPI
jgi:hypothetical protein